MSADAGVVAACLALALAAPPSREGPEAPEPMQAEVGPGRKLIAAGTGLVIGSVAAYGVMAAGLGMGRNAEDRLPALSGAEDIGRRRDTLRRGRVGNILAISGGVSAAVLMAAGISLIVVGRRRAAPASLSLLPLRRGGGVSWSLRF